MSMLIHYQFLQTQSMRIVWQTVRRITYEILGVKRLPETGTKNLHPVFNVKRLVAQ